MIASPRLLFSVLLAAALFISPSGSAQHQHVHDDEVVPEGSEIGTVNFDASCDEAVRADFDRALGLMHHMMYAQARAAFEAIAEADPECAMAYWGIATTRFQPLWPTRPSREELERGWREIQKARELQPATERERLLVEATAAFFEEPERDAYWDRVDRWAEGMAAAHEANPEDLDTAALYALSRLALAQTADERDPLLDEAEEILREVWAQEHRHPGAIHYAIHATDVDGRAKNALDMVEMYGEIAPEVPHALHMPSHIYVRLGDWPEVISWNRRSADAALKSPVDGAVSHHYLHAIDYLIYAYLQKGEDEKAVALYEEAMAKERHQPSFISAFHAAAMPARLAIERQRWEDAVALEPGTPEYLPWDATYWPSGMTWYARGLGAVHTDNLELAREAEQRLEELREEARAADENLLATYIELDRRILSGWIAHAQGNADEAIRLMRSAAELEGTVEKHPVTPGALLPPREALGDLLMDLNHPEEALAAYEASDDIWPGRFHTLAGAAEAANAAGREELAREYYSRLLDNAGESNRPTVLEAHSVVED